MKRKEYESRMRILHGELVAMQEWVKDSGAKICVVFEGRDTAGKGARLNIISHLLSQVPYKPPAHRDIKLPRRQPRGDYVQPDLPLRYIPTPF
jgi:polyphosphate kinase